MKKHFFLLIIFACVNLLSAQTVFNPQIGMTFTGLKNLDPNRESKVRMGTQFGMDVRIGDRFYVQPGLYYIQYKTVYVMNDSVTSESKVNREALKLRALLGFNIVHQEGFKLRVNVGPTLDATIKKDNGGDPYIKKDDITDRSFNMDIGLGVDVWFLTLEVGYSDGLSKAIKNLPSKYQTMFVNVGIVF